MTVRQIGALYATIERDGDGVPKLTPPRSRSRSDRELFTDSLYYAGITDPETVAELWAARVKALRAANGDRRRRA